MQDFYDNRKQHGAFSWREFCKNAGFTSPNFLKLVCMGQSSLSKVKILPVAKAMGLVGYEIEYFTLLVEFGNAIKDSVKKETMLKMENIAKEHKIRIVDSDAFQFYESWKYPVIRELAPIMPGAQPRDIAEECKEYVSAEEVRNILQFLQKAGFLKKDAETGKLLEGAVIKITDPESGKEVLRFTTGKKEGFRIEMLEDGKTYKACEVKAPEGYERADDVSFTVGKDDTIVMKDRKKEKALASVPATGDGSGKAVAAAVIALVLSLSGFYALYSGSRRKNP